VSDKGANATVTVTSDPAAVATAVQSLVTAANNVLSTIGEYSNNTPGSTAVLRGDSSLRGLAGQVIDAVTYAVGGSGSAAGAGIQLSKDGKRIEFSADTFTTKLKADPALAQNLVNGSGTVPGVAQRLLKVAKDASDSTTGTLATLANGKDREVTDLQKRIDDWDLRLDLRQQTLTRQFTAMESALGTLQNQSSWLSSQLSALPSWSKSSSK
jgi:flagellar hook-associated protein 2